VAKELSEARAILQVDALTGAVTVLNTYVTQESTDTTLKGNGATNQRAVTPAELDAPLSTFISGLLTEGRQDAGL